MSFGPVGMTTYDVLCERGLGRQEIALWKSLKSLIYLLIGEVNRDEPARSRIIAFYVVPRIGSNLYALPFL